MVIEPGGYLQWDELDTPTAHVTCAAPDLETEALEQLRGLLMSPMKGQNGEYGPRNEKNPQSERAIVDHYLIYRTLLGPRDWIQEIPDILERNGFCNAEKHIYCEAPYMAGFWNDVYVKSLNACAVLNCDCGRFSQFSNAVTKIAFALLSCVSV